MISLLAMISCATSHKTSSIESIPDTVAILAADSIMEMGTNIPERSASIYDLPDWIDLSTIEPLPNEVYAIGISDPKLNTQIAHKQAITRAKLLISLMSDAKIKDCKEIYTNETEQHHQSDYATKFTRFQQIKSKLTYDESQFQIVDSITTRFGEKIILLKYTSDPNNSIKKSGIIESTVDVMLAEYNLRTKFQENKFFNCMFKASSPSSLDEGMYRLYKVDEISDIVSTFNDQTFNFSPDYFKYLLHDPNKVPDYPVKTKLYYGLWKAYFESMVIQLSNFYVSTEFALQTLSDNYSNEEGKKSQSIDQQIHTIDFSGKITRLYISENELTLQIEKTNP